VNGAMPTAAFGLAIRRVLVVHQDYRAVLLRNELATSDGHRQRNVGLGGAVYSGCVSNLLVHLGAVSAVSSENPLKSLRIRADFDSTIRVFKSSDQTASNGSYQRMSVSVGYPRFERTGHCLQIVERH